MNFKALIAALLLGLGSGVWAAANLVELRSAQMNGSGFSSACRQANESWISFCNGYVQAVVDSLREADSICIPTKTTRTDIVTLVEKEITASNHLRSLNAYEAVRTVLTRSYRCP